MQFHRVVAGEALDVAAAEFAEILVEDQAGNKPLQKQVVKYILLIYPDADMEAL